MKSICFLGALAVVHFSFAAGTVSDTDKEIDGLAIQTAASQGACLKHTQDLMPFQMNRSEVDLKDQAQALKLLEILEKAPSPSKSSQELWNKLVVGLGKVHAANVPNLMRPVCGITTDLVSAQNLLARVRRTKFDAKDKQRVIQVTRGLLRQGPLPTTSLMDTAFQLNLLYALGQQKLVAMDQSTEAELKKTLDEIQPKIKFYNQQATDLNAVLSSLGADAPAQAKAAVQTKFIQIMVIDQTHDAVKFRAKLKKLAR